MNMKFDLDIKKWLPLLRKLQPYIFGIALVGVFGYTALLVNAALNVKPATSAAAPAEPKISFDKKTIDAVKKLDVVQGSVPAGELGKTDPFK